MRLKTARKRRGAKEIHMGFQIAPMIDVVFVILLYFMLAAGTSKKDSALQSRLPGVDIEDLIS